MIIGKKKSNYGFFSGKRHLTKSRNKKNALKNAVIDKVGYKKLYHTLVYTYLCAFPYIYSGKWISELFRPEFFSHSHKRNDREISKASSVEQSGAEELHKR